MRSYARMYTSDGFAEKLALPGAVDYGYLTLSSKSLSISTLHSAQSHPVAPAC